MYLFLSEYIWLKFFLKYAVINDETEVFMARIEVFYPGVLKREVLTIACRRWGIGKKIIKKIFWLDLIWLPAQPGMIKIQKMTIGAKFKLYFL